MDMKEKLQAATQFSGKKTAAPLLVYLLGLLGLVMVAAAGWLFFSDATSSRAVEKAKEQGGALLGQLAEPVQSFKRIMADEQALAVAARALESTESASDLVTFLEDRTPHLKAADVYSREQAVVLNPVDLGDNGYAVLDMILMALEGKRSLMQVHGALNPPLLYDAFPLGSGDTIDGVLVVAADPAVITDTFNPDYSSLGFVRLSQYNGRQPPTVLKEFGDPGLAGEVPDRMAVPGTTFRVEYPQARHIGTFSRNNLILLIAVGLACVAVAFVLQLNNRRQAAQEAADKPPEATETMPVATPEQPAEIAGADAGFDDEPVAQPAKAPPESPPPMHLQYDIAERRRQKEAKHAPVELDPGIFRAYDIRGIIDKTLDSGIARSIGQAVGSEVIERGAGPIVVARDGRLSGPYLMKGVIEGIVSTGCDVIDIGAVPTGVLYYAAHEFAKGSAIMITGSHNPPDYNGFKVMVGGNTLHGDAIMALHDRIAEGRLQSGEGHVERRNVLKNYILRISEDVKVEKPLRVVIDCGNGIGGVCAADTLRALGVEVLPLYDEVDGTFPNHHPDPSEPENLQDLIESVRLMDADLGLALDGDADRLGVVTLAGNIIYPDRVLMLLALDVLDRVPGATILFDVKCTGHLPRVIREAGGNPVMYKTGHSLMKAKMKEMDAPFAGEMSGHFFFGERWYGVDDGIYAAARLLEILGGTETPPEAILNALPTSFSTPELKVEMDGEGENHAFVEAFKDAVMNTVHIAAHFEGAEINTIDGLRADFEDGWGLVRASNTTPVLIVRFDAESEAALERIKTLFRRQMTELKPDLELPF